MAPARDPWWVIGSAAVALLSGTDTGAQDVDVLLSAADAESVATRLGIAFGVPDGHPLFRSERFFRWDAPPLPVEFMAGFAVRTGGNWSPVILSTRRPVAGSAMFVPEREELRALLLAFGRPKDLARAALL